MPKTRPTIRDVAAQAGVSRQTVSRVLNGDTHVAPATKQHIENIIAELDYRPSVIARSMVQGRTMTLACVSPNLTDYTFACLIEGAETEARQHGYFLLSATAPTSANFAALIDQVILHRRADGLLVINPYIDDRHTFLPVSAPTVLMGARSREARYGSVSLDEACAAHLATKHLLSLGHQRIALVHGPLAEDCSQERWAGYVAALRESGIAVAEPLIVGGDWSASSGEAAARILLQRGVAFSAVFAQNDRMAVGVIRALREANRPVPHDVSVIGFDDIPLASYFDPPLTTMRQDIFALGRAAARQLIELLEHRQPARHIMLPAELVVRQSTATFSIEGR